MQRAVETASTTSQPFLLSPILCERLREIHHGRWEKMQDVDVEEHYPEEYAAWQEDPFTFAPQGGESGMARALPVIREIVSKHTGAR